MQLSLHCVHAEGVFVGGYGCGFGESKLAQGSGWRPRPMGVMDRRWGNLKTGWERLETQRVQVYKTLQINRSHDVSFRKCNQIGEKGAKKKNGEELQGCEVGEML